MKNTFSNIEALAVLKKDHALSNISMEERLNLRELVDANDSIDDWITLTNCDFNEIEATMIMFNRPFVLNNCTIGKFEIYGSYFLSGFEITNCVFNTEVPFMHASHGINGGDMKLKGNVFNKFIDFEDTNFKSTIEITDNEFKQGTNLLTVMQLRTGFESDPVIENNSGQLDVSEKMASEVWKKK